MSGMIKGETDILSKLILSEKHGIVCDYGWMNNPTTTSWVQAPKEITPMRKLITEMDMLKPNSHSIIWDTISSSVNSKSISFYTGYNKDSIFDYKPFKKWASEPLLSCEYALMLDVLKTA